MPPLFLRLSASPLFNLSHFFSLLDIIYILVAKIVKIIHKHPLYLQKKSLFFIFYIDGN